MPIKYVPFVPEPVEGQAVLQNFNRILKYKGSDEVTMTLQRGMPLYEVEKKETVGDNPDGNMVIRGECVSACAYLREQGIEVDLVYIDPPFASGADYAKKVYIRRNPKVAEAIKEVEQQFAEQEIDIDELKAFEEKMYGDVWDKEKYLNWMYENLMAIKSVMRETASIFVHLDWHIGAYVKILLDEVFGEDNFRNEIIWCYTGPGSPHMKQYNRKHDTIYWYTKSNQYYFYDQQIRIAHDAKTLENFKKGLDGSGFITDDYDLDEKGKVPEDWWQIAIAGRFPVDGTKRVDYATEKPWALVERIINTSSEESMRIADFFGGSGVTATVANQLERNFIHCDIGINSIQITRDRLVSSGASFEVLDIKDGVQLYRNPVQTMDKIKAIIPGLRNEESLDSFWEGAISDSKEGMIPVYVPNLMDSTSKLLDTVMMNRIIHEAIPDLPQNTKRAVVYYVDITDENEIRSFINDDDSTNIEIELRDLKMVLDDVVVGDEADFHVEENRENLLGGYIVSIDTFISDRVSQKIMEYNQKAMLNTKKKYYPIEISKEGLETIEFLSLDCTSSEGEWHSDSEIKIDKKGFVILNGEKTTEFWDGKIRSQEKPLRLKIRNICGDETIYAV